MHNKNGKSVIYNEWAAYIFAKFSLLSMGKETLERFIRHNIFLEKYNRERVVLIRSLDQRKRRLGA